MGVLAEAGLSGTNDFTIADTADTVAASLDNRDVAAVSAAFATAGLSLSTNSQEVIVSVADDGKLWYVTDMVNVLHYQLSKSGGGAAIQGSLEAQFYVVPQTTQLGLITVEQGFRLNGTLDLFGFKASLTVQIEDAKGLWIDCAYSPMIIAVSGHPVLSVRSDDGATGPMLSVCTYQNSTETDPDLQQPHFFATGAINVLGVASLEVIVNFTESGGTFDMTASQGGASFQLSGGYAGLTDCSVSGSANVGVDTTLDMGSLGKIRVETLVDYTFAIKVDGTTGSASASGGFSFEGVGFSIPAFTLSLSEIRWPGWWTMRWIRSPRPSKPTSVITSNG